MSHGDWLLRHSPGACPNDYVARKLLFDGKEVSHILPFDSPNNESADTEEYARHVGRISLSGVQPKASLMLNAEGQLVKPAEGERGQYILK